MRSLSSVLLALMSFASAQPALSRDLSTDANAYLAAWHDARDMMGSVLIAQGDTILYTGAIGSANLELGVANSPDTRFRIGSVTKQFTAALILDLDAKGLLSVDDSLSRYLPDFPRADEITLQQLLNHTAGVADYTSLGDLTVLARERLSTDELIATFADAPLDFEPGSRFAYSNSGYVLLTKVVEMVTGLSYEEALRGVLEPLSLTTITLDNPRALVPNRANGYALSPDGMLNAHFIDPSIPTGAGALTATVFDLYAWSRALLGGTFQPDYFDILRRVSSPTSPEPGAMRYADGWFIGDVAGRDVFQHSGGTLGFSAYLSLYPAEDLVVVVLANVEAFDVASLSKGLAALALGDPYTLPEARVALTLDDATLARYAGRYEMPDMALTVAQDGPRLVVQPDGEPAYHFSAASTTRFFIEGVGLDITITFDVDDSGTVTGLVLDQGGQQLAARRLP